MEGEGMKMDLRFLLIFAFTLTACGKQVTSSQTFQKPTEECAADVAPNQYIIRYRDGSVKSVVAPSLEEFFRKHVDAELAQIAYTEPDFIVDTNSTPVHADATSIDNWGVVRVAADALWSAAIRGAGIAVAVVDSGMDLTHSQLRNQLYKNAGEQGLDSSGRDKSSNGIDDDANGLVDDAGGWDFVGNRPLQGDYQAHGSHVSGIVAAEHSDTTAGAKAYVQGMAPAAKILPLAFLGADGRGTMSMGVQAIQYAVKRGARVINASWGGAFCSKSLRDTVASLSSNVIFVAAAGNGDRNGGYNIDIYHDYPASFNLPSQLTVGATGSFDLMTYFSNYGTTGVHIFAPGEAIISTVPGGFEALDGTSMAAPIVSGAVALLLSAEPSATAAQVRQALYASAYKQGNFMNASSGRLDLRTALTELRRAMSK
jgi:subtilisin family serine protease